MIMTDKYEEALKILKYRERAEAEREDDTAEFYKRKSAEQQVIKDGGELFSLLVQEKRWALLATMAAAICEGVPEAPAVTNLIPASARVLRSFMQEVIAYGGMDNFLANDFNLLASRAINSYGEEPNRWTSAHGLKQAWSHLHSHTKVVYGIEIPK